MTKNPTPVKADIVEGPIVVEGHTRLLSIDPSSTRTGYAIMTTEQPDGVVEAGYLKPHRTKDPPITRIDAMCDDLLQLIQSEQPTHAAIELTSGKVGKRHKGRGAGLATYGMAIGAMWQTMRDHMPDGDACCYAITENLWTAGQPKAKRLGLLAQIYPAYASQVGKDRGGDVGDAIGLGRWWFIEMRKLDEIDRQTLTSS